MKQENKKTRKQEKIEGQKKSKSATFGKKTNQPRYLRNPLLAEKQGQEKTATKKKNKKNNKGKQPKSSIQEDLISIYKDEDGLPDMSKLEKIKSHRLRNIILLVIGFLILLLAAAWLGFVVFGGFSKFSGEKIKVEIEAPQTFTSGEEISYIIKYSNQERLPISKVEISAQYPQGFIFESAFPQPVNESDNRWSLGTLPKYSEGEIKITGRLLGNIDSDKTITAYFDYRPANFNSDFQEVSYFNTKITSSVIDVELETPAEVIAGEPTNFIINYKNNFKESLKNIKIVLIEPENFSVKISEPEISEENNTWLIDKMQPDEERKIEFVGAFLSDVQGSKEMTLQIELQNDDGTWYLQQEKTFILEVLKGELIVNLIINGSTDNQTINFGDTINYSIVYKNKGQTDVKDLVIKTNLVGNLIDWESLEDENNGTVEDQKIIWTSEEIEELSLLEQDDEGIINWQIKIKDKENFEEEETIDSSLMSWVDVDMIIGETEDSQAKTSITSKTIINELNSDLILKTAGRYFNEDNIALGSGPLPPEVGKTTSYRIIWSLTNSVHEISNVKVKTILPENVYWTGKSVISAGQLNFNVNTREIIWTINLIPLTVRKLEGSFEVSINPTNEDEGNLLVLTPETTLEAYDKKTNDQIFLTQGAITTNLDGDIIAEGKGIVIE